MYREDRYHRLVILAVLMELQMANVLSYLSLKNIFAAKCCSRLINQLVCSRRSTFWSKILFQQCMVPYLERMEADPGFLSSILASNLVQWAHLGQTPALACQLGNESGGRGGGLATQYGSHAAFSAAGQCSGKDDGMRKSQANSVCLRS